jgi:hypothetical protein
MALQTVTVNLPKQVFHKVRQLARNKNRSVEDELVAVVENALDEGDVWAGVPSDVADEVEQLRFLDDEHLWRAAQLTVAEEKSERMQILSQKQKAEGLTVAEKEEIEQLQHLAQRVMLVRAEAAVLLQERGYNISRLHS